MKAIKQKKSLSKKDGNLNKQGQTWTEDLEMGSNRLYCLYKRHCAGMEMFVLGIYNTLREIIHIKKTKLTLQCSLIFTCKIFS